MAIWSWLNKQFSPLPAETVRTVNLTFSDYARATLEGAHNVSDQSALSSEQVERTIQYLTSPGSGAAPGASFATYVLEKLKEHPAKLPYGMQYISFSGIDGLGTSNYASALAYVEDAPELYGTMCDTPWGMFIEDLRINADQHPDFLLMEQALEAFMEEQGVAPFHEKYAGALRDMMWNAGCAEYITNAVAAGGSLLALVENAPRDGSFNRFELTTLLTLPNGVINGYPVSAMLRSSSG